MSFVARPLPHLPYLGPYSDNCWWQVDSNEEHLKVHTMPEQQKAGRSEKNDSDD
jgi:hypothetical protein